MIFRQFLYPDTGCAAYLVGCGGKGVCAIVDPQERDVDAYVEAAAAKGMAIRWAVDTHVHADHRTGGPALAARTGAAYALHRNAAPGVAFQPLDDGEAIEAGNVVLRVIHTPGHTDDSVCLLVTDRVRGPEPWFLLTGDTLFVGSVGRPDLPGEAARHARELYHSVHKLLALPATLEIYPAHFAGSACGAGMSGKPSSTLAFERRWNPLLGEPSEDRFVERLLATIPAWKPSLSA